MSPIQQQEVVRSAQNHAKIPFMKIYYTIILARVAEISITRLPHPVTPTWGMEMEGLVLTGDTGTIPSLVELVIGVQGISRLGNWKDLGCQFRGARVHTPQLWFRYLLRLVLERLFRLRVQKLLREMGMGMIGRIVSARLYLTVL